VTSADGLRIVSVRENGVADPDGSGSVSVAAKTNEDSMQAALRTEVDRLRPILGLQPFHRCVIPFEELAHTYSFCVTRGIDCCAPVRSHRGDAEPSAISHSDKSAASTRINYKQCAKEAVQFGLNLVRSLFSARTPTQHAVIISHCETYIFCLFYQSAIAV
jgi:hypothetical protein